MFSLGYRIPDVCTLGTTYRRGCIMATRILSLVTHSHGKTTLHAADQAWIANLVHDLDCEEHDQAANIAGTAGSTLALVGCCNALLDRVALAIRRFIEEPHAPDASP